MYTKKHFKDNMMLGTVNNIFMTFAVLEIIHTMENIQELTF